MLRITYTLIYHFQSETVLYNSINGVTAIVNNEPIPNTSKAHFKIFSFFSYFERPNLKTASNMVNEANGTSNCSNVYIISIVPYSSVVRQLVYNGTIKNRISFDPMLPILKIKMSVINFRYLFIFHLQKNLKPHKFPLEQAKIKIAHEMINRKFCNFLFSFSSETNIAITGIAEIVLAVIKR